MPLPDLPADHAPHRLTAVDDLLTDRHTPTTPEEPMTGPEHYREAERLIAREHDYAPSDPDAALTLAAAQVHATLALAAATALSASVAGYMPPADSGAWRAASATRLADGAVRKVREELEEAYKKYEAHREQLAAALDRPPSSAWGDLIATARAAVAGRAAYRAEADAINTAGTGLGDPA